PGLAGCVGSAACQSQARISCPLGGRNPVTTSNALRDDVPTCGASVGSFWCSRGITLASSTSGCRAPPCHIVGRASDIILLRVLMPVSLATCTLLTGYRIEYSLLMRFLAHRWDGCGRRGWRLRWPGWRL